MDLNVDLERLAEQLGKHTAYSVPSWAGVLRDIEAEGYRIVQVGVSDLVTAPLVRSLERAVQDYRDTKAAFGGDWADGVLGMQRTYAEETLGQAVAALIDEADAALAETPGEPE